MNDTKTKTTPATPLPYITNKREEVAAANDFRTVARCVHASNAPQDAAYIVHAANAYPKLVEALKEAIATTSPDSAFLESRVALLRSLGEDQ